MKGEVAITSFSKWLETIPVSSTTGWRWIKRGWITPINIAGRLYLTRAEIENFETRAANGEFARRPSGAARPSGEVQ